MSSLRVMHEMPGPDYLRGCRYSAPCRGTGEACTNTVANPTSDPRWTVVHRDFRVRGVLVFVICSCDRVVKIAE